jgi:hypothetical protein
MGPSIKGKKAVNLCGYYSEHNVLVYIKLSFHLNIFCLYGFAKKLACLFDGKLGNKQNIVLAHLKSGNFQVVSAGNPCNCKNLHVLLTIFLESTTQDKSKIKNLHSQIFYACHLKVTQFPGIQDDNIVLAAPKLYNYHFF